MKFLVLKLGGSFGPMSIKKNLPICKFTWRMDIQTASTKWTIWKWSEMKQRYKQYSLFTIFFTKTQNHFNETFNASSIASLKIISPRSERTNDFQKTSKTTSERLMYVQFMLLALNAITSLQSHHFQKVDQTSVII